MFRKYLGRIFPSVMGGTGRCDSRGPAHSNPANEWGTRASGHCGRTADPFGKLRAGSSVGLKSSVGMTKVMGRGLIGTAEAVP